MSDDAIRPPTLTREERSPPDPRLAAPPAVEDRRAWRIAVDRGGTFTDVVAISAEGRVEVRKVPTDPGDAATDATVECIRRIVGAHGDAPIPARRVRQVRCGTTAATNALLERRGERCALLVTRGFRDLLTIRSQERPDIFALHVERPAQLADAVFEIRERVLADGTVRTPLDAEDVVAAAQEIHRRGIRSVAVLFLHAYAHPQHELEAERILRASCGPHTPSRTARDEGAVARWYPLLDVFLSHRSARELGAVARGETAAADAYLTPVLRRSLDRFRSAFAPEVDVRFVRSDGGLSDAAHAHGPAAVLSGPAAGALAVTETVRALGLEAAIGFDMGGTSTDVCRAAPDPDRRYETRAAGFRLRVPALRVHTIAAGGGSILTFDGRRFRAGPESAGASPGPAGYGRGGPPTITDADAVLGRLLPATFPACFGPHGRDRFDVGRSRAAIAPLADAAGLSVEEAAAGFVRVANERMAQAIREESVLRGHDLRRHALVAFGGAGPQHACNVADALGIARVVVPRLSSVLSAWGAAGARAAAEAVVPVLAPLARDPCSDALDAAARGAEEEFRALHGPPGRVDVVGILELRVLGSDAALPVELPPRRDPDWVDAVASAFRAAHVRAYGFGPPEGAVIEAVHARVRMESRDAAAATAWSGAGGTAAAAQPPVRAWFAGPDGAFAPHETRVVRCEDLGRTAAVDGPALLVDRATTVVVPPGWGVSVPDEDHLLLERFDAPPVARIGAGRDPVSLALFANAFMSVAERMGAVLERTSHSTNIKERLDFSCALFDGEGRLVANAPHIPVHLGAMGESVRAVLAARGGDLREGDCVVTNDPYRGGSHLPDVTVVTPVAVRDGRPAFFVANRAHHADVGGVTPGSMPPLSRTIDEEGVRIHDLLLVRDGALREDDVRAALAAGPHPARAIGERLFDFRAQAAANHEGARLLRELCDLHGGDVVAAYMGHVQDDGAAAFEETLAALPEGVHEAEETLDDGTPLRVTIRVEGGRATVDFAGTGPQSDGNLNAPAAVVRAAVLYAIRTLVRRPIPLNEGCLRPLDIRIPPGSILDPRPPAAVVGGNVETSQRLVDLVLRAVGACAASQGTMNNTTFGTPEWTYYETVAGGTGAGPEFEGASGVQCHMTNTRITDVEVLERVRPVAVRRFALRPESGGRGAHCGGDGLVREIEFLAPVSGGVLSERRARGAPGLAGGADGAPGRNTLRRAGGAETPLAGRAAFEAAPGDVLRIETPGGGGWGRPGRF